MENKFLIEDENEKIIEESLEAKSDMNFSSTEWIIKEFNKNRKLNLEIGKNFLFVWSVFESEIFDRWCYKDNIEEKLKNLKNSKEILSKLKNEINFFKNRYQNSNNRKNLWANKGEVEGFKKIIESNTYKNEIEKEKDELIFLVSIVFRFRNNIFHGNKSPFNWNRYEEEIEKCIKIMCFILEKNRKLA